MILVINLNASLDKRYLMQDLKKGKVMRVKEVQNTPGGKGIHVANVATILEEECLVTGFLGGKTGEFIEENLKGYNIKSDFINIKEDTRECLAIITEDLVQTEMLEPGPEVSEEEQERFIELYNKLIDDAKVIVASGSVPRKVPTDFYSRLMDIAHGKGKKFLLDTSGVLLQEGIKGKPYFIKPNKDEVEALTGSKINSDEDVIREIKNFQKEGIELVAVSLGSEGSIVGFEGKYYKVSVPKIKAVNPVGSGDSFVAGIAVAINRGYEIGDCLRLACACGTANAMEEESGFVRKDTVLELFEKIVVEEV